MRPSHHIPSFIFFLCLLAAAASAQSVHMPSTTACGGATASNSAGATLSYSLGQTFCITIGDTLSQIEQGIQHPLRKTTSTADTTARPGIFLRADNELYTDDTAISYASYRWYRDGQIVAEGATLTHYRQPNDAPLYGCYHLEVSTSAQRDVWISSDTLCIGSNVIASINRQGDVTIYPNPVAAGAVAHVHVAKSHFALDTPLQLISAIGNTIPLAMTHYGTITVPPNTPAGIYTLIIPLANGKISHTRLIVE